MSGGSGTWILTLLINSEVFSFTDQHVQGSHVTAGFVSVCFQFQPLSPD